MSEIETIRRLLAEASLPEWVENISAELMIDHTDEPAVRMTVFVRDDRDDIFHNGAALTDLNYELLLLLQGAGIDLFPYTRYLSANEAA